MYKKRAQANDIQGYGTDFYENQTYNYKIKQHLANNIA